MLHYDHRHGDSGDPGTGSPSPAVRRLEAAGNSGRLEAAGNPGKVNLTPHPSAASPPHRNGRLFDGDDCTILPNLLMKGSLVMPRTVKFKMIRSEISSFGVDAVLQVYFNRRKHY